MDLDIFKDEEWGPWISAVTYPFKDGDIFVLGIDGPDDKVPIYKAEGECHPARRWQNLLLRKKGSWHYGHSWQMICNTVIRLPLNSFDEKTVKKSLSRECPCGIFRDDCTYHK